MKVEVKVSNRNIDKYASYLDWRISPHAERPNLHTRVDTSARVPAHVDMSWQNFSLFGLGV